MSLPIVYYPHPALRRPSQPAEIGARTDGLVLALTTTMATVPAFGLAAPQIAISRRVAIVAPRKGNPYVLINPEIVAQDDDDLLEDERCLSLPGFAIPVSRPGSITVQTLMTDGTLERFDAEGIEARIICHEIDHLNGVTICDHLEAGDDRDRFRRNLRCVMTGQLNDTVLELVQDRGPLDHLELARAKGLLARTS